MLSKISSSLFSEGEGDFVKVTLCFYFSLCSEFLSEFSSTLSISSTPEGDQATPPSRTAVSSTRVLFDVLSEFLGANSDQSGVEALPLFLEAFLHENRYCRFKKKL